MEIHIREMGMAYRRLLVRSTSSYPPPRRRTRDLVTILWDCVRHGPGRIDLHELVRDNPSPFPNRLLFARCPLRLVDEEKRAGVDGVDGDRLTRLASIFLSEKKRGRQNRRTRDERVDSICPAAAAARMEPGPQNRRLSASQTPGRGPALPSSEMHALPSTPPLLN